MNWNNYKCDCNDGHKIIRDEYGYTRVDRYGNHIERFEDEDSCNTRKYYKKHTDDLSTPIGEEFGGLEPKPLTQEEILIDKIKKIKRTIDDSVYELIEKIINTKNKKLSKSLQKKLEYLGITWYNKIVITNTMDLNQLKKDIILSFIYLNFDSDTDLDKFKFVISKIKQFQEWEDFFEEQ